VRPAAPSRSGVLAPPAGTPSRAPVRAALLAFTVLAALLGHALRAPAAETAGDAVSVDPPQLETSPDVAGMFLVARRELQNLFFGQSVVVLLNHDENGTQGLVVNRRLDVPLSHALPDFDRANDIDSHKVFFGGPLSMEQFFLLTSAPPPDAVSYPVTDDLYFSNDRHVLDQLLEKGASERELHLYLGYAGWAPGQLARELLQGNWYLVKRDPAAIFEPSAQTLWERMIEELDPPGIEVRLGPETTDGRRGATDGVRDVPDSEKRGNISI
jgi:putative transcriptional regulator